MGGKQSKSNRHQHHQKSQRGDKYDRLDQVTKALQQVGLGPSNFIVGIDFAKSNEFTGAKSFDHKCLHHIGKSLNPYEQTLSIIGNTVSCFDECNQIPCFGFGDASTKDKTVFPFYPDYKPCNGFQDVKKRYREIVPEIRLAGPTSFAPIIEKGIEIVENSGGEYHVLLIIADGQVTGTIDSINGGFSDQEQATMNAIVKASGYPMSIVVVGVGDGPFGMMKNFCDNLPFRAFNNFRFVNFTKIMSRQLPPFRKKIDFAFATLKKIPSHYNTTRLLELLGRRSDTSWSAKTLLPSPLKIHGYSNFSPSYSQLGRFHRVAPSAPLEKFEQVAPSAPLHRFIAPSAPVYKFLPVAPSAPVDKFLPVAPSAPPENPTDTVSVPVHACPVCCSNSPTNLVFGCGHETCRECGEDLWFCPICGDPINTRTDLY